MITRLLLSSILGAFAVSAVAQSSAPVTVTDDNQVWSFAERPRLSQVMDTVLQARDANQQVDLYWPASRLISDSKQAELNTRKNDLKQQLQALEHYWQQDDEPELAKSAQRLRQQLATWCVLGAEWAGQVRTTNEYTVQPGTPQVAPALFGDRNQARVSLDHNPLLPEGNYTYVIPAHTTQLTWQVVGVTEQAQVRSVSYDVTADASDVASRIKFATGSEFDTLTVIDLSGQSTRMGVSYYNDSEQHLPFASTVIVPFKPSVLPDEFETINDELKTLAQYLAPADEAYTAHCEKGGRS